MSIPSDIDQLSEQQLRELTAQLLLTVQEQSKELVSKQKELTHKDVIIQKLTFEMATLKRHRFGRHTESFNPAQGSLLDELVDADIAAIEVELAEITPRAAQQTPTSRLQPKRKPLPAELPRTLTHHEPDNTRCTCGCQMERVGEDVSEKLDYVPGVFSVERHVRGKWACRSCETLTQAPVPAHVIDKGIPTTGLLAQVLVAKFADHLPLYRQEQIFARAGVEISRSTQAEWVGACGVALQPLVDALKAHVLTERILHADETPVEVLMPGKKKTHKAYVWGFCTTGFSELKAVIYTFAPSRAGEHARAFFGDWKGLLVCDDYSGYKQSFAQGMTEIGCMAHARRKFFDLHAANKSTLAEQGLQYIQLLYEVERDSKDLTASERYRMRQEYAKPVADALHQWMILHRQKVPENSAIAKALDYSLKRWTALMRYLDDGEIPIDNNQVENRIRPWALGRKNWLFAGSLRSGQRAAAVMSLIQSAKLNGHDPYVYLKDVLSRLPTQKHSAIDELLPHRWQPQSV